MPLLLSCWLLLGPLAAAPARAQDVALAIRAERWADAEQAAAALPDPAARKLAQYYRLLAPGAAHAAEIAAFMSDNPDWPQQAILSRRLQEALSTEADDKAVMEVCARRPPTAPPSLLRCADAASKAGRPADALAEARRAWLTGITDPATELAFIRVWGKLLTPDDQWARFERLIWTDNAAPGGTAARQLARLGSAVRSLAGARLALRRDDASALALVAALPPALRSDPGLMLDQAKWLRRAGQDEAALALWQQSGTDAERAAPAERRPAFWDERNLLARRRLRAGDPAGAYALASGHAQSAPEQRGDAEFLAGWIALRRLGRPGDAAPHFQRLAELSGAAITQGRAHYWLGRAAAARGDEAGARAEFARAAAWPTTFYGQLASHGLAEGDAALAARIAAARDPAWTSDEALGFTGQELARAALLLVEWGEPRRARAFLLRLDEVAQTPQGRALSARLAAGLDLPDLAVTIARRAGRDGVMLPESGWPVAAAPPGTLDPATTLGIIRQESSFDAAALSPAGARGLMQLMPATAQQVARKLGEPASVPALTGDPAYNMRLGSSYLRGLLDRFGGALPLAAAGYNAGPGRVQEWLASNGDPLAGTCDMVDWIELIPFNETRNYVQRVVENVVIYRVRLKQGSVQPLAQWLG